MPLDIYIGYDPNEALAWEVCRQSLEDHASQPLAIHKLEQSELRKAGVYSRTWWEEDGQRYDIADGLPFSTEFSFTRFLTPALCPKGWALFVDSDFLFRADVAELFALADDKYSVMCVKHDYRPSERTKMRGQIQQGYRRKNWSSLVLWNGPRNTITSYEVNTRPGWWLHGFKWLGDDQIGALPPAWNHLEGTPEPEYGVKAEHFTRGTPDMPGYEKTPYAYEWWAVAKRANPQAWAKGCL